LALHSVPKPDGRDRPGHDIELSAISLIADPEGALYWPEHGLLAVSDLHLEKGSSFAARGLLMPPYDTAATLARLTKLIARYAPRVVVALGDSFHDGGGPARLSGEDRDNLAAMQRGRDWIWITGNHDPEPADGIGGAFHETFQLCA
jgi:DNA ligase-associated metallophosphoesterase